MKRAATYVRISRDREGAGLGVARQRADCQTLADTLDATVTSVYSDNDISAYSGKPRPGYRALLDDMRNGAIDVVLAWHTDRLHRSPVELEEYIAASDLHGVPTHTVKAGPLDLATPSGRLVARQLGAVARYEVEHMVERTKRAKQQALASGQYRGGPRPYGYEKDGVTVRADEAAELLAMTKAVLAGASVHEIARQLNERGLTTSTGRPWVASRIGETIRRPRNAGLMTGDGPAASWPAIVPEDIWRGAVAILTAPGRQTNPVVARKHLGGGLYLCGVCLGHGVDQTLRASTAANRRIYVCNGPVNHLSRRMDALDSFVQRLIVERLSQPDAADAFLRESPDLKAVTEQANGLRARIEQAGQLFVAGSITDRQLADISAALSTQLEQCENTLRTQSTNSALLHLLAHADIPKQWDLLGLTAKRTVIGAVCRIVVMPAPRGRPAGWRPGVSYFDPDLIEIYWNG